MDIVAVKKKLNSLGYGPLSVTGSLAPIYGPKSIEAVKAFQKANGLLIDGIVGAQTLSVLFPADVAKPSKYEIQKWDTKSPVLLLKLRALGIARSQVGVREKGNNSGPAVTAYLASVGLAPGNPYCAAGIYWSVDQAARELNLPNPLIRTGKVLTQWANFKGYKFKAGSQPPQPGDIFCMKIGNDGAGHMGMVDENLGDHLQTVEFNSNSAYSSNGNGVYLLEKRKAGNLLGFIRI